MMRRISSLGLVLLAVLLCLPLSVASAQEGKIGYVDSQRIFAESKDFADAQAKFDKDVAAWNKQAEEMQTEIEQLEQDLKSQSLMLSKEKREEKERALPAVCRRHLRTRRQGREAQCGVDQTDSG
jgi:outer membrane protein